MAVARPFSFPVSNGEPVSHPWLCLGLILSTACSEGAVRSASLEQPTLVFRCEQGQVSAYLVMDDQVAQDSVAFRDQAVRVDLDSAPPCFEAAP
jgi:hypothetical protein